MGDYYYECSQCRSIIPAWFDQPHASNAHVFVKQLTGKSETTFKCDTCYTVNPIIEWILSNHVSGTTTTHVLAHYRIDILDTIVQHLEKKGYSGAYLTPEFDHPDGHTRKIVLMSEVV